MRQVRHTRHRQIYWHAPDLTVRQPCQSYWKWRRESKSPGTNDSDSRRYWTCNLANGLPFSNQLSYQITLQVSHWLLILEAELPRIISLWVIHRIHLYISCELETSYMLLTSDAYELLCFQALYTLKRRQSLVHSKTSWQAGELLSIVLGILIDAQIPIAYKTYSPTHTVVHLTNVGTSWQAATEEGDILTSITFTTPIGCKTSHSYNLT